jgi:hypothetical protein
MNVLIEMAALASSRPSACCTRRQLGEWYGAKARLHEQLANEDLLDRPRELALALSARRRSEGLLGAPAESISGSGVSYSGDSLAPTEVSSRV